MHSVPDNDSGPFEFGVDVNIDDEPAETLLAGFFEVIIGVGSA